MFLRQITDPALAQNAYLIGCQRSGEAIVIDPERDVDRYFAIAAENGLKLVAVAETHIHADYLSGARELVERHGLVAWLSAEGGPDWQYVWAEGNPRVNLIRDGATFGIGKIRFEALHTPGHTPEHLSFLITDQGGGADQPIAMLSGDFIFAGDVGRPDLLESAAGRKGAMEPSARKLYSSLREMRELADYLQILPGHGAGSACGKALGAIPISVLGYERRFNPALVEAMSGEEEAFVKSILSGQPEPPLYFARMKRDNRKGPALLEGGSLPAPRRIDAPMLARWVGVPGCAILDLRSDRKAFMARQLKGAIHAPLGAGKIPVSAGSYIDEDERILLVAEDDSQIDRAVRQLVRIGLDRVEAWIPSDEALAATGWTSELPRRMAPDFGSALAGAESPLVLDVRGADEYAAGHVDGALNIPYTRLAARLGEIPDHRRIFVHCASGLRAAMAASFLASKHFDVVHIDGSFDEIKGSLA